MKILPSFLAMLALGAAVVGAGVLRADAVRADASSAALPNDSALEAAGARIGTITIKNDQIFDLDDPRENKRLYRVANSWHARTRADVIRAQLLFASGEPYRHRLLEETETKPAAPEFPARTAHPPCGLARRRGRHSRRDARCMDTAGGSKLWAERWQERHLDRSRRFQSVRLRQDADRRRQPRRRPRLDVFRMARPLGLGQPLDGCGQAGE